MIRHGGYAGQHSDKIHKKKDINIMKTDVYKFDKTNANIESISGLTAKIASYNGLDRKQELKLSLLCEELVGMLPNLLKYGKGCFWIENDGNNYKIHAIVEADSLLSSIDRDEILSVSSSGKNAAAVGIMSKIRIAAEVMLANYAQTAGTAGTMYPDMHYSYYDMGRFADPAGYNSEWSLSVYREHARSDEEAWDELEKSIIANLADDVTVGIIDGKVEIVVTKSF